MAQETILNVKCLNILQQEEVNLQSQNLYN